MSIDVVEQEVAAPVAATLCRLSAEGVYWRVLVAAWRRDEQEWVGRLVFEPEGAAGASEVREGPPLLRGRSRAEVVASAHEIPERHLRLLLHSLV
ncbi:MAG TPA: hypothetical protein VIL18_03430 [Longimicrobiales bacterium]